MTADGQAHGHVNTYKSGCRCTACRDANTDYQRVANARRRANPALADAAGHGRAATYINYGCRCPLCREANRRRRKAWLDARKERTA